MLAHEKFKAYQLSLEFIKISFSLINKIPKGNSAIKDQLKRASLSIPLNIAEGTGKRTKKEKDYFYSVARGSAMECGAICDVVKIIDVSLGREVDTAKVLIHSIVSILSSVCLKGDR